MKKLLAALLAGVMVVSLAACGGKASEDGKTDLTMWCIATESDSNRKRFKPSFL